jgi:hypothetical protein
MTPSGAGSQRLPPTGAAAQACATNPDFLVALALTPTLQPRSDAQAGRGELDPDVLRADARRYHGIYGTCGISVFAVRGLTVDEMAQQVWLVRFDRLTLIKAGEFAGAGLRLEPTGWNPRHNTVGFDDLDRGMKALTGCDRHVMTNPYHDA